MATPPSSFITLPEYLPRLSRVHFEQESVSVHWDAGYAGVPRLIVTSGQLTFYEYDDPTCSPHVYSAGQGFVDYGNGHIGVNQDPSDPASDVTVAVTYVGGPFR